MTIFRVRTAKSTRHYFVGLIGLAGLVTACGVPNPQPNGAGSSEGTPRLAVDQSEVERGGAASTVADSQTQDGSQQVTELEVDVMATYPHDPEAFTQGLEIMADGTLLESTGLRGASDLRLVNIETGEVERTVATPSDFFAEGATKVGDEIVQITWQDNTALYWDAATFELNRQVTYEGEGWGICFDGQQLIMTDGSAELTFRDTDTFEVTGQTTVTSDGMPVNALNEVECVDGVVWANRWTTDEILAIDPTTGLVQATVDASAIRYQSDDSDAVLNGIAWDQASETFLLTGKLWPNLYRVEFVPTS